MKKLHTEKIHTAVRLSPELKSDLEKIAMEQGMSLNFLMNQALKDFVKKNSVEENTENYISALRRKNLSDSDIDKIVKQYLKDYSLVD